MNSDWLNSTAILNNSLSHYNDKRFEKDIIEKCYSYFKSLNVLYREYYYHRKKTGKLNRFEIDQDDLREGIAFTELCLQAFLREEKIKIIKSKSLANLINLTPLIVNEKYRRQDPFYDPSKITSEVREKFSKEHQKLIESFEKYRIGRLDIKYVIIPMIKLLYVVRSNIAHGEKTPQGPDIDKYERDKTVCNVILPLLELTFDIIFNYPSNRLAVYGTLAPGEPNNSILSKIINNPHNKFSGVVRGSTNVKNNLPFFNWRNEENETEVLVYESNLLTKEFTNLDRFEGKSYKRILVPIKVDSKFVIANIYSENIN